MMKKLMLYFALLVSISETVKATTYQVNDEVTFKKVILGLLPGDEVIIANGSYTN